MRTEQITWASFCDFGGSLLGCDKDGKAWILNNVTGLWSPFNPSGNAQP